MGDRGNIIVKNGESTVYLYTHWGGSDLKKIIKAALIRGRSRWSDGSYLARILFCEMIKEDVLGETGFGISSVIGDGGTDIVVDVYKQKVNSKTFEEFVGVV